MKEFSFHGVRLTAQTGKEAIVAIIRGPAPMRVHFATVHSLVEATGDARLSEVFDSAAMVCTDGMPLVWLARRRGALDAERVAGPDTILAVCDHGRAAGLRHFFLGGAPGVADALAARLAALYPGLQIAGTASPPFRDLTEAEDVALIATVNAAAPDCVWIGLGSPKQDFWAEAHEGRLKARAILAVGAAFDFHSGKLRRAPAWMQRSGLEWLFRLAMEPRRLGRRYLVTNTRFVLMVLADAIQGLRGPGA